MGRHLFGVVAPAYGVFGILWHVQLESMWHMPGAAAFIYVASAAQIAGGVAIQFRQTMRAGALVLGVIFTIFALTWMPAIATQPLAYISWGNVFERLSFVAGAMIVYGGAWRRAGIVLFGVCVVSFAAEQAAYIGQTAALVPKWLPPGRMFWAIATTIAFALAAVSILSGYQAKLASRLLTLMLLIFGVVIWIPIVIADPRNHTNWGEMLETFAIAGVAWIVADALAQKKRRTQRAASLRFEF